MPLRKHTASRCKSIPAFGYAICVGYQESGVRNQESENQTDPMISTALPDKLSHPAPTVFDNLPRPVPATQQPKEHYCCCVDDKPP